MLYLRLIKSKQLKNGMFVFNFSLKNYIFKKCSMHSIPSFKISKPSQPHLKKDWDSDSHL